MLLLLLLLPPPPLLLEIVCARLFGEMPALVDADPVLVDVMSRPGIAVLLRGD